MSQSRIKGYLGSASHYVQLKSENLLFLFG